MDGATRALLGLWDLADDAVSGLGPDDWGRPLVPRGLAGAGGPVAGGPVAGGPVAGGPAVMGSAALGAGGADVTDLVTHLVGVDYAGPERLRESLGEAHRRARWGARSSPSSGRVLQAQCLDMCLHTHDLHQALGVGLPPGVSGPAALAACRLVSGFLPRLLARSGEHGTRVRVLVRASPGAAVELDRTVGAEDGAVTRTAVVEADAEAFLLLVSGRRSARELAEQNRLAWGGSIPASIVGG